MTLDVVDLREFYVSPLGQTVRRLLRDRLTRLWPDVKGETILALGYGTPLLRPWLGKAERVLAMMPETQGVAFWPREGPNIAALADLSHLPLEDESVSRVILLHALETAPEPEALLAEVWRVLKPNGRLLALVPNRRGLWAHAEGTPFGTGEPYSTSQLRGLLRKEGFAVERAGYALYAPPGQSRLALLLAFAIEKILIHILPAFGGLLVVEAGKHVYAPAMVNARSRRQIRIAMPFPTASGPLPTRNCLKGLF